MGTNSVSPHYATTTDDEAFGELETSLRRQIKDTLDGVTTSYDKLDDRIQIIEQRLPKNLRFRLKTLEDYAKPHDVANDARQDSASATALQQFEKKVDAMVTSKLSALEWEVNAHKVLFDAAVADIESLRSQLDQNKRSLELLRKSNTTVEISNPIPEKEQNPTPSLETYSHDELARELLKRLEGGQTLSPTLRAQLQRALKLLPPSSSNEMPKTITRRRKRPRVSSSSSSLSELSSTEDKGSPAKRVKSAPVLVPTVSRTSPRKIFSMLKTTKVDAAAAAAKPSASKDSKLSADVEMTPEELEQLLQDEPRRSGRAPKPARNPQFMSWSEVIAAKKGKIVM